MAKPSFVCEGARKMPPVDEMSWDFACREQMGLRLQGKKIGS